MSFRIFHEATDVIGKEIINNRYTHKISLKWFHKWRNGFNLSGRSTCWPSCTGGFISIATRNRHNFSMLNAIKLQHHVQPSHCNNQLLIHTDGYWHAVRYLVECLIKQNLFTTQPYRVLMMYGNHVSNALTISNVQDLRCEKHNE